MSSNVNPAPPVSSVDVDLCLRLEEVNESWILGRTGKMAAWSRLRSFPVRVVMLFSRLKGSSGLRDVQLSQQLVSDRRQPVLLLAAGRFIRNRHLQPPSFKQGVHDPVAELGAVASAIAGVRAAPAAPCWRGSAPVRQTVTTPPVSDRAADRSGGMASRRSG